MIEVTLRRGDAVLAGERSGEGPPVLLLHAGGERRSVWRPVARELAGRGYRCTAYDLRGHGDSDPAGADELVTHSDDVVAMIAAEARPPVVVGASIGGLATLLALNRTPPAHVAGLVLVDVVPHLDPARVRAHLNGVADGYGDHPLVVDVLRGRAALDTTTEGLAGVPTLLVRGERSPLTGGDVAWFRARVPHGVVATVPGAGHLVARDAPALLADVLRTHLGSAAVRRRRMRTTEV